MLKLSINSNIKPSVTNIEYHDFCVSKDLSIISGICDSSYSLKDKDTVLITTQLKPNGIVETIDTEDFYCLGTFSADTTYQVHKFIQYINGSATTISYVDFSNGKYYYEPYESGGTIYIPSHVTNLNSEYFNISSSDTITVKQQYYITGDTLTTNDGKLYNIYIRHGLSGGSVNSEALIVDEDNNVYNSNDYEIFECAKHLTKFYILPKKLYKISIENAKCAKDLMSVNYNDKIYLINQKDEYGTYYFTTDLTYNDNIISGIDISNTTDVNDLNRLKELASIPYNYGNINADYLHVFKMNDKDETLLRPYSTFYDCEYGKFVSLFLEDTDISVREGNRIMAVTPKDEMKYRVITDFTDDLNNITKTGIFFNDRIYEKKSVDDITKCYHDFIVIGDEEYEFHYYDSGLTTSNSFSGSGYIVYDEKKIDMYVTTSVNSVKTEYGDILGNYNYQFSSTTTTISGNNVYNKVTLSYNNQPKENVVSFYSSKYRTNGTLYAYRAKKDMSFSKTFSGDTVYIDFVSQPLYGVKRYDYIEINGNKYNVQISGELDNEYVVIEENEKYTLEVLNILGNNWLLCKPIINNINYISLFNKEQIMSNISYDIMSNYHNFDFFIKNDNYGEDIEVNYDDVKTDEIESIDITNIGLHRLNDFIEVPIFVNSDEGNNLLQENLLNTVFVENEKQKTINRIVDMDKDVYYPYYHNNNSYKEVEKINFDFHFRTRNLENWKINEDYTNYSKANQELEYYNIFPTFGKENTNWFSLDYYSGNTQQETHGKNNIDKVVSAACINSDLLFFLNFTNDDVFYQKSKINKSFIRLLFYDSPNPSNQSLIYQATVWLDGNSLYKRFINNVKSKSKSFYSISSYNTNNTIDVSSEPFNTSNKFTYEHDKRLDSRITISNRYLSNSSSEGFYLHLFKELSEGTCEHTIYMKVMFNHAGEGQTCLFTLPRKSDGKIMTNNDFKTDASSCVETLKDGIALKDVINYMYIPIKIKFLEEENRFVYLFEDDNVSDWNQDNNEVTLNFFEIKMKDESN